MQQLNCLAASVQDEVAASHGYWVELRVVLAAQRARRTSGSGQIWAGARAGKDRSPAAPLPYVDWRGVARIRCAAVAALSSQRASGLNGGPPKAGNGTSHVPKVTDAEQNCQENMR